MRSPHAYRPDIDGLRAIAIFVVVIYHLGKLSKGGFIGVDVFFVISGFLITSIILADMDAGCFSLANFYERRIRRIFPALFACLAATIIAGYFLLYPSEFLILANSVIAATFFVANLFYIETSGYFGATAQTLPILHTWSLAVEEQFYLLFPLALLALTRARREVVIVVLALTALASLACSEFLVRSHSTVGYYHLASRAWELLLGSLLALGAVPEIKTQRNREILSVLGLLAILIPTFAYNKSTLFPGISALVPCLGAVALIHTGRQGDTSVARLLSTRPFVGLGLISYSLYLWHLPIITFYRLQSQTQPTFLVQLLLVAASLAVAYLSWRYIEQPFRLRTLAPQRRHVFVFGATAAGSVAMIAALVVHGDGWKERYAPEVRQLATFKYDPKGPMREGTCFISRAASRVTDFVDDNCLAMSTEKKNVLIVGDSHAAHLWAGLSTTFPNINFLQVTASGCAPDLVSHGSTRCREIMTRLFEQVLPGKQLDATIFSISWKSEDARPLLAPINRLAAHSREVLVFGPLVTYNWPLPRLLTRSKLRNDPTLISDGRAERDFRVDTAYQKFFKDKGIQYVSLIDVLCKQRNDCTTVDERGYPLQFDKGHLTDRGSALLARRLSGRLTFAHDGPRLAGSQP
jgi:peptidoglycan/LPS O-acetylase OafA/YrhL